jgi:hypothetical protein
VADHFFSSLPSSFALCPESTHDNHRRSSLIPSPHQGDPTEDRLAGDEEMVEEIADPDVASGEVDEVQAEVEWV